jgi:hypothetical protein
MEFCVDGVRERGATGLVDSEKKGDGWWAINLAYKQLSWYSIVA